MIKNLNFYDFLYIILKRTGGTLKYMLHHRETKDYELIVIHTNSYAGHFSREMVSFITSHTDESESGFKAEHEVYEYDYSMFKDSIKHIIDESENILTPFILCSNHNYVNNGLGYHYHVDDKYGKEKACQHHKDFIKKNANQHINNYKKVIQSYQEEGEDSELYKNYSRVGWNIQKLMDQIKSHEEKIEESDKMTTKDLTEHTAYNSIAIVFVRGGITESIIDIVKECSQEFVKMYTNPKSPNFKRRKGYANLKIERFEIIKDT